MSLRTKLSFFFIVVVVIPIAALAVLITQVSDDSSESEADARLATGLETARTLYDEALARAPAEAKRVALAAGAPLQASDEAALTKLARTEEASPAVAAVTIRDGDGTVIAQEGPFTSLAAAEAPVTTPDGGRIGLVRVATLEGDEFIGRVRALTSLEVALASRSALIDSTVPLQRTDVPAAGDGDAVDLQLSGSEDDFRAAALGLDGAPPGARVALVAPRESGFLGSQPLVAGILIVFFAGAFFVIALLLRNLQVRIARILEAARRIGDGNFEQKVPVDGNDEMAGLAVEFNKMSDRLSEQVGELRQQRRQLEESVQRIGEAFASGLDRGALLEIVLETAVGACAAEGGRVILYDRTGEPGVLATEGLAEDLESALDSAAETAVADRDAGNATERACHAIAHAMIDRRDRTHILCTVAIARKGEPFSDEERGVLRYLVGQTAISIENIGLHERVAAQALTDELTGVSNHRHFSEWIDREVARVERFGGELSLIMLDIDDFKGVNDDHGHLQGDRVLEEIGRILRIESRGVDETARYGGEEFVLALPETGTAGAVEVAERLRVGIERASVPSVNGGAPITVTASLGVATIPGAASDVRSLIAAADSALYQAKRAGKNRVASSGREGASVPQGNRADRRS